jgi:hypothetical protein
MKRLQMGEVRLLRQGFPSDHRQTWRCCYAAHDGPRGVTECLLRIIYFTLCLNFSL